MKKNKNIGKEERFVENLELGAYMKILCNIGQKLLSKISNNYNITDKISKKAERTVKKLEELRSDLEELMPYYETTEMCEKTGIDPVHIFYSYYEKEEPNKSQMKFIYNDVLRNILEERKMEDMKKEISVEEMKGIIVKAVKKEKWIPMIEIEKLFKDNNYDYKGNHNLYVPNTDENIVIWSGWNENTTKMICDIFKDGLYKSEKIAFKPVSNKLEFICLGGGLDMPLAESPNRKYNTPHWLPRSISFCRSI